MAAQLTYGYDAPKAIAGQIADLAPREIVTRSIEDKNGAIHFGMAVQVGTKAGSTVKLVSGAKKETIDGVVAHAEVEQNTEGKVVLKNGQVVDVIKHGNVWGRIAKGAVVTPNAIAYVVGTGEEAGYFTHVKEANIDIGAVFGTEKDEGIAIISL